MHKFLVIISLFALFIHNSAAFGLEPNEILIIANKDCRESVEIANYYCQKRNVPAENILPLALGTNLNDTITRDNYEKQLAGPIREKLYSSGFAGKIRCLLATYGIPIKVTGRGQLTAQEDKLSRLKRLREQTKQSLEQLQKNTGAAASAQQKNIKRKLAYLQSEIDRITGRETDACVDSELSMVLFDDYELYQWQPNKLKYKMPYWDFKSLMVCRLDAPGSKTAKGLIDKALSAEKTGLRGIAYIDSGYSMASSKESLYYKYDQSLRELALLTKTQTQLPVAEEHTDALFAPGQCPSAALYCGWYSLQKYVDAFDFTDGAIGYHIASLEAVNLRDPNSNQWCPAMLKDGVTATIGAVAEPYLNSFPEPKEFFAELFDGYCLVEAYYRTKPFNSWRLILIGDPLYRPFKKL